MTPREYAVQTLLFTRSVTEKLLDGIPEEKVCFQPAEASNHVLWQVGHLASAEMYFGGMIGAEGVHVPDAYNALFNEKPRPRGECPPYAAVLDTMKATREAMLAWARSAPESALVVDLREKSKGFINDPIDGLIKIGWHEGWHAGQISEIRKALGLKPAIG